MKGREVSMTKHERYIRCHINHRDFTQEERSLLRKQLKERQEQKRLTTLLIIKISITVVTATALSQIALSFVV